MEIKAEDWQRVKELFLAALDIERASRCRFLEQSGEPSDLCHAVEELLLAHEQADSLFHLAAVFAENPSSGTGQNCLEIGSVLLDRFRILRFIAQGGMGEVYEAQDLELQARVALKTIRPAIGSSPQVLARFKREVHLARNVTHPNVCRIFDLFRHRGSFDPGNDILFVSMELLNGQTLAERIRQAGRMSPREVLIILRQIVPALGVIHASGILHRDLKPSNIVLEPQPDGGIRAVITDFGMAWSLDSSPGAPPTGSGQFAFGTPEYMSPEQIEGRSLTPASDIYSLGLVIYQMITGIRAFGNETPLFSALRRLKESPPLPSRVAPELGTRWDSLVSRCLDPDPARRFSSAQQLRDALGHLTELPARRYWNIHSVTARQAWSARRWELVTSLVCISVVMTGAYMFFPFRRRKTGAENSLTIVLADFVNTTGDPSFDRTLNVALERKLQQSPFINLMPEGRIHMALRYMGLPATTPLTRDLAMQVCERERGQIALQGTIAPGSGGYDLLLGSFACTSGKSIARELTSANNRDSVLTALDHLADLTRKDLGESSESIRRYNVSLADASTSSMAALTAYSQGLTVSEEQGEYAAEPYFLRAVEIDPNFAIAYVRLAQTYWNRGDIDRARQTAIQGYARRGRVTQWERFYILSSYYAIATGELKKEMQTYEEWARVYPRDAHWPLQLAVDYSFLGQYQKSAQMLRLEISDNPESAAAYGNLAINYLNRDRPDEARAILTEADHGHLHEINMDWARYWLAFYDNDTAGMNQVLSHATAYPGLQETLMLQEMKTDAYQGRLHASRELERKMLKETSESGESEMAAISLADEGLWEAEFGQDRAARTDVSHALAEVAHQKSEDAQIVAALTLATIGEERTAQSMTDALKREYPLDTMLNQYWLPVVQARIALHQDKPQLAAYVLDSTTPYETGIFNPLPCMYSVYVRGQAHLAMGHGSQAAVDFREIISHRGVVFNCPTGSLSQLGLARSLMLSKDISDSRTAYQDLFSLWKNADRHLSPITRAHIEYSTLQ